MSAEMQKQQIARLFDQVAGGYDCPALRLFPICADRLLARLRPRPGEKLLDVATGTGALAVSAAQAVIPGGRVTGIDLSEGMLARAEATAKHLASGNIDWHVMDAERLDFKGDYFHVVACSFGLFFIPDMALAVREWARVTRPGGRVGFSSFAPGTFQPLIDRLRADVIAAGGEIPPEQALASERLTDPGQCVVLLEQAGLVEASVKTEALGYHLAGADDWWAVIQNSALRGLAGRVPDDRQAAFRQAHLAAVQELVTDKGLWLNIEVHFATGTKPA